MDYSIWTVENNGKSSGTLTIIISIFSSFYFVMKDSGEIEFINLLDFKLILLGILILSRNFYNNVYCTIYQIYIKMHYIEIDK